MCGGFLRHGIDFTNQYVLSFIDSMRASGLSWAILILDVVAAFESLQRFFVFAATPSDEQIATVFKQVGFDQIVFSGFVDALQEPNAFAQAGVSGILAKLVCASHPFSWYSLKGLGEFVATRQRTKPGDLLGDFVFAYHCQDSKTHSFQIIYQCF